jgi:hypothetical protein
MNELTIALILLAGASFLSVQLKPQKKVNLSFSAVRIITCVSLLVIAAYAYFAAADAVAREEKRKASIEKSKKRTERLVAFADSMSKKNEEREQLKLTKAREEEQRILQENPKIAKAKERHPDWRVSDIQALLANEVWIGMPVEMLIYKMGKPDSKKVSNYGSGNQIQYCWLGRSISCFYDHDGDGKIDAYN